MNRKTRKDCWQDIPTRRYTGLKDKYGKKIFEGNTVKAYIDYGPAGDRLETFVIKLGPWGCGIQKWNYNEGALPEIIKN